MNQGDTMHGTRYTGEHLRQIRFLLGGIGTGNISLEGRGSFTDWEIFNRPGKGRKPCLTFVGLRVQIGKEPPLFRVVARQPLPPYEGSQGFPRLQAAGMPHFHEAVFTNRFPFAHIAFREQGFPLAVSLEAFSPFIPHDADASGLPVAVLTYRLENLRNVPVTYSLAFAMMNPVGSDGTDDLADLWGTCFGGNINRVREGAGLRGLFFSSDKHRPPGPRHGNISLVTDHPDTTIRRDLGSRSATRRGILSQEECEFWRDFEDGRFTDTDTGPSPDGRTKAGCVCGHGRLAPGEAQSVRFIVAWYFPWRVNTWGMDTEVRGKRLKNYYATRFADSFAVACYFKRHERTLSDGSRTFSRAFFSSTLPPEVLNTVSSQLTVIRSPVCFRTSDGRFYAFEGASDCAGCCPLNCTHVWNYAQALAFLFPELERSMRRTDYLENTDARGAMAFRTNVPLGIKRWEFKPAADGQMGTLLRLYREWRLSGDTDFLRELWSRAKATIRFAWTAWDVNRDGLMEGEQHTTYDIEFFGENPLTSLFSLGALKAAIEMAEFLGDADFAGECRAILQRGRRTVVSRLWNGDYFIQTCRMKPLPPFQHQRGCLADQILGELLATVVNLGGLIPPAYVRKTLASILRYNFRDDFSEFENRNERVYAIGNEAGLLMCTWPRGGRPEIPVLYADEVWTGTEFQVATHLVFQGMTDEALRLVRAIERRYDGLKRNPFDHLECGHHYARALSCWGLLLAYPGFWHDNVRKDLFFRPAVAENPFSCFFAAGTGWGTLRRVRRRRREVTKVRLLHGWLDVRRIIFATAGFPRTRAIRATLGGRPLHAAWTDGAASVEVSLADEVRLTPGRTFSLTRTLASRRQKALPERTGVSGRG